jgi:hypothetical protein
MAHQPNGPCPGQAPSVAHPRQALRRRSTHIRRSCRPFPDRCRPWFPSATASVLLAAPHAPKFAVTLIPSSIEAKFTCSSSLLLPIPLLPSPLPYALRADGKLSRRQRHQLRSSCAIVASRVASSSHQDVPPRCASEAPRSHPPWASSSSVTPLRTTPSHCCFLDLEPAALTPYSAVAVVPPYPNHAPVESSIRELLPL